METQVLILGGGVTGTGLARDLALRGIESVLVERKDINAGASGANHGLLHSGARYVSTDPASAAECQNEGRILRQVAPHCIEDTGGLFVALPDDDPQYVADFPDLCAKAGITASPCPVQEVVDQEPAVSPSAVAAYAVNDASIDPFQLSLENMTQATDLGATYLDHTQVMHMTRQANHLSQVRVRNMRTGEEFPIQARIVVNACGAWSARVAAMAGITLHMLGTKGTLAVTHNRLCRRVINRLRPPGDGDILVPGGTVSILGTTSIRMDDFDHIQPTVQEVDRIVEQGSAMLPCLETTRYIRAYAGVRPLVQAGGDFDDRSLPRGYTLLDHAQEGIDNFITITGGKLTTFRLMAEKTADLIGAKLGVDTVCRTRTEPLPSTPSGKWTEAGRSPVHWVQQHDPDDLLLCECEMIPRSTLEGILESLHDHQAGSALKTLGLRSRLGKGACQGAFCSLRVAGYLYEQDHIHNREGLAHIRDFIASRWAGQRPVLWNGQLTQAELTEALYCGLLGLELSTT